MTLIDRIRRAILGDWASESVRLERERAQIDTQLRDARTRQLRGEMRGAKGFTAGRRA